jgi:transcriptional regulator with GAF, ATPase, and Fis domain
MSFDGKSGFNDQARLNFELLITEITSSLVNPDPDHLDRLINEGLQKILDSIGIDRAVLWKREAPDKDRFVISHLRSRPGTGPQEIPAFLSSDSYPWITNRVLQGKETQYSRINDLPDEAAIDKESIRKFGPKFSSIVLPLFDVDGVYGIMTLGIAKEFNWPETLAPRLRVLAQAFSGALIRNKTEQKLQETLKTLTIAKAQLEHENIYLRHELNARKVPSQIFYQSGAMAEVLAKVEQVAATNSSVLLIGETGTGKELIASAIHEMSTRSSRTMIRVNCGAIPSALVESEMFGREKGAYTGALSRQIGRFELAHESTIFLDEITELPLETQVKLLRVLQEKEIQRLGNPKPIHVNVRIIAATNQDPEKVVREGRFREDLYYRLNVFPIEIPPLRERREDIPILVWSFVDYFSAEFGKKVESISKQSMDALLEYSWPGNVREVRNTIERSMIMLNSNQLIIELPKGKASTPSYENRTLKEAEIQHIRRVLASVAWRIRGKNGAAELLGMKPTTLETRMAKLGIVRPDRN